MAAALEFEPTRIAHATSLSGQIRAPRPDPEDLSVCRVSGRTRARTGLRMMPTFPASPLRFRTAGFPQYGSKAGLSDRSLPAPAGRLNLLPACPCCVAPVCICLVALSVTARWYPAQCGQRIRSRSRRHASSFAHRSTPGALAPVRVILSVVHQRLIGPIRPTRRHIAISSHCGLYASAFAVLMPLDDPRVVPCFRCTIPS